MRYYEMSSEFLAKMLVSELQDWADDAWILYDDLPSMSGLDADYVDCYKNGYPFVLIRKGSKVLEAGYFAYEGEAVDFFLFASTMAENIRP